MHFASRWQARLAALSVWGVVCLILSAPATSQPATQTFSGQAAVVKATVAGVPVVLSETRPLPPEGGAEEASLLEASVPDVLSAQVLHASAVGQGNASRAEASVANLDLTVAGNRIEADFLMARAEARCTDGRASVQGRSSIVDLRVNDQSISVGTGPNQTIDLPNGGRITINEQRSSSSGNTGEITVTALHVVVPGVADVAISQAHADIACRAQAAACTNDFVTGGGWITSAGNKNNFAVGGGIKNKGLWGHLTYIARSDGSKVKGTGVTEYTILGPTSRRIRGTAEINGQGGFTYEVDVTDNGEPGRGDTFKITLDNGHTAMGNLEGGNIQLHACREGAPI